MKLANGRKHLTRRRFLAATAGAAGAVTIGLVGAAIPASAQKTTRRRKKKATGKKKTTRRRKKKATKKTTRRR